MSLHSPSAREQTARGSTLLAELTLDRFMVGLAALVVVATGLCMGVQSDTWWQLRTGQLIVQHGSIPTTDLFSSTVRGGYWPNHEWLAQVIFYLCYRLGGLPLLLGASTALVALTCWGLYRLCEGPPRVRALAVLGSVAAQAVIWSARPHLFSMALLVATLLLLPERRRHWLYPPLFLLWANIHAGVAFGGLVLLLAFVVGLARDRREGFHWLIVGLLSGLATLLNPLGLGLWTYVLGSLGDVTRTYLQEWQAPNLSWPSSYPFFVLFAVCVVSVLRARGTWSGHRDWTLLLLALLLAVMGFRSIRHTAFFAIVAAPLIARQFSTVPLGARRAASLGTLHLVVLVGLMGGGFLMVRENWASVPEPPLAPGVVAAVRQCDGTLFNTYDTGGPLIWLAPERAVFVDNRQDPYPTELLLQAAVVEQRGEYHELFAKYGISCALVPADQPLHERLHRDGWDELYRDEEFAVLRRGIGMTDWVWPPYHSPL
jgi:hypothetical protein